MIVISTSQHYGSRQCVKEYALFILLILQNTLASRYYYHPHFASEALWAKHITVVVFSSVHCPRLSVYWI